MFADLVIEALASEKAANVLHRNAVEIYRPGRIDSMLGDHAAGPTSVRSGPLY